MRQFDSLTSEEKFKLVKLAEKKLLVLVDKDFKLFMEDRRGKRQAEMAKANGIEIMLVEVDT